MGLRAMNTTFVDTLLTHPFKQNMHVFIENFNIKIILGPEQGKSGKNGAKRILNDPSR